MSWTNRLREIPGGQTHVGTNAPFIRPDCEGPRRKARLEPYRMDPFAVTNAWFAEFVADTGYRTEAEQFGWSLVFFSFTKQDGAYQRVAATPWWCRVDGADWAHPFGPHSDLDGFADHPVTQVSWHDAMAFATWAGGRLPSEVEWEHAARGGDADATYPWGETEPSDTEPLCNIWQGNFPQENTCVDGFAGTAPVDSFGVNPFGLYNMAGNVWEWSKDIFRVASVSKSARLRNADSVRQDIRLLKGGSFLCHKSYCYRYRIAARTGVTSNSATSHMGFRLAM
ncbi:formylglycine-generating enzyme family protein [Ruegeria jejuensis]|uniref:formylglycine-generating enzyme family protein n=1 Tax=Ruegeria jejuensis TaxID=3233338 RepID=UPI00355C9217